MSRVSLLFMVERVTNSAPTLGSTKTTGWYWGWVSFFISGLLLQIEFGNAHYSAPRSRRKAGLGAIDYCPLSVE
jgi:hypothetical protein